MSPINVGRDYFRVITNRPKPVREPEENAADRMMFAYREWHEHYGQFQVFKATDPIMPAGLHGAEYLAQRRYGLTPLPTETPVDRWMERLRHG